MVSSLHEGFALFRCLSTAVFLQAHTLQPCSKCLRLSDAKDTELACIVAGSAYMYEKRESQGEGGREGGRDGGME